MTKFVHMLTLKKYLKKISIYKYFFVRFYRLSRKSLNEII